ncbi:MFS transporter [Schaalia sp. ZJ405]|uniref:MFS transporter n=1 Tax=Schaalia sp. ZJ405 TaxID=2709403 RepID=UPI0018C9CAA8|nr:MFS transporter [Schaalia sp. ZJ405]
MSTSTATRQEKTVPTVPENPAHAQSGAHSPTSGHPHVHRPHLVMSGLYVGAFLGMLSETSMNIALPSLMDHFNISAGIAQWMVVGYMLAIGIILPFVGILLKWVNAKTLAQCAAAMFFVGALMSTLAPNFAILLTGRMLQGIGTGIVLPILFSAIVHVFPPHLIGAATGIAGLVIMFAPVIGPTAAGILVSAISWRAIFALFAIVACVSFALLSAFFTNPFQQTRQPVDAISVVTSIVGFGGLVCGVSLLSEQGFSPVVIALIGVGVIVIGIYAQRQLTIAHPVLDLAILGRRDFRASALIVTLSFTCTLTCMYIVPLELQRGLSLDSSVVGMLMLPAGIINAVCSMLAGRLFDRFGAAPLVRFGALLTLIGIVLFTMIGTTTNVFFFIGAHVILMVGIPFIQQPAQSAALSSLPRQEASDGSTILNTLQQVAGAIGTAIATCLIGLGSASNTVDAAGGFITGSRFAYVFAAVLVLGALAISLTHRSRSAGDDRGEDRSQARAKNRDLAADIQDDLHAKAGVEA